MKETWKKLKPIVLLPVYIYLAIVSVGCALLGLLTWNGKRLVTADRMTVARSLLVIPALILLWAERYYEAAAAMVISYIGDTADGTIARMFDEVTEFGAYLDRTLDKIGNLPIMLYLLILCSWVSVYNVIHNILIIFVMIVELEGLRLTLRNLYLKKYKQHLYEFKNDKAAFAGKLKMATESIAIILTLVSEGIYLDLITASKEIYNGSTVPPSVTIFLSLLWLTAFISGIFSLTGHRGTVVRVNP